MAKSVMASVIATFVSLTSQTLATDAAESLRAINAEYDRALVNDDVGALDRIYSEDFTYTNPDGVLRSKPDQIAFVRAGKLGLTAGHSDDVHVRVYGDFAIITGRFNGVLRGAVGQVEFRERYTTTWLRRADRWVLLAEQGNIIK